MTDMRANVEVIVSAHIRLDVPDGRTGAEALRAQGELQVELDDGRRARLDPQDKRSAGFAEVLAGLEALGRPVYLEVETGDDAIRRLLVPAVGRVSSLRESAGGLEVQVDASHARYLLPREQADFAALSDLLREADAKETPVVITADDAQNVIDVRFFRPGSDKGPAPWLPGEVTAEAADANPDLIARFFRWRFWPWRWWWYRCVSPRRAQEIFDAMSAQTCSPAGIAPPCIPFLYPDDGCWGRAHEMRRLMIAMGIHPRKVWIFGSLHTPTRNNPNCAVNWGWHVAPTICVRHLYWWWPWRWFWFWFGQRMVIDPSLFTGPVTKAQWKSVQGDPGATLNDTDGSVFHWYNNQTDPTYAQTNQVLSTYRLALQNRVNQVGAPPYANCP